MKKIVQFYQDNFKKLIILQIALCLLFTAFITVTSKREYGVNFGQENLSAGHISEEGYAVFGEEDGEYGLLLDIVTGVIKKGWYKVKVEYDTGYDDNGFIVQALKEGALNRDIGMENRTIRLRASRNSQEIHAWLEKDSELRIAVHYCGGGYLQINRIMLRQIPDYTPVALMIAVLLLLNVELYETGRLSKEEVKRRRYARLGIAGIVLLSSLPLMNQYNIHGHDYEHHLYSIEGIAEGLLSGQFPVRIMPNWWNEFGDGAPMFYADAMMYIPALLLVLGYSMQTAYKFYIVFINLLTAWIAYKCFVKISKDSKMALLGAFLYTLNLYRLIDIYIRCAVGEYTALTFLPLILLGIYLIEKEGWIYLALGVTGCIQSHMLVCVMSAFLFLLFCLLNIRWVFKRRIFLNFCKAGIFSLLWNLWFIVPFLNMYGSNAYKIHVYKALRSTQEMGVPVSSLFYMCFHTIHDKIYVMGLPLLAGLALAAVVFVVFGRRIPAGEEYRKQGRLLGTSIVLASAALLLSMEFIPYNRISLVHRAVERLVSMLEFPFRFMGLAALLSVAAIISACTLWKSGCEAEERGKLKNAGYMAAAALVVFVAAGTLMSYHNLLTSGVMLEQHKEYYVMEYRMSANKWLPLEADDSETDQSLLTSSEDIAVLNYDKKYTNISMLCANDSAEEGYIDVPLFYYPCYKAEDEETGEALSLISGENARIRIMLPPGYQGKVTLRVSERKLWRMMELISVLSAAGALWLIAGKRKRKAERQ